MDLDALEKHIETRIKNSPTDPGYVGLTDDQARAKLMQYGPNVLTEKKQIPWPIKLLLEFTGLFNIMLWVGSALCFIGYGLQSDKRDKSNLYLGIVVIVVICITAVFAF